MSADPIRPVRYPTRILCPTDFTDFSRRALEYAIALARPGGGEITLLHVLLLPLPSTGREGDPGPMPREARPRGELLDRMRRFAEAAVAAGLTTRFLCRSGAPGIARAGRPPDALARRRTRLGSAAIGDPALRQEAGRRPDRDRRP